eukprot:TRINITY_DN22399_c0_g1_i1.p1 TRINITY_DN22399_c0_g1~~TRINITY_DN22399_c0_g1_i1.p1  ORF type:complete len:195 (-),score=54.97 TRINITY_DN22399_c0_g1_i1:139-723(-)
MPPKDSIPADSLFYRLYPRNAQTSDSTKGEVRWAKVRAGVIDEEDEEAVKRHAEDQENPSEGVMTGALAAMAFMQQGASSSSSSSSAAAAESAEKGGQKRKHDEVASNGSSNAAGSASQANGSSGATANVAASGADDGLSKLSIKELKQRITAAGIQLPAGATEKTDLVNALRKAGSNTAGEKKETKDDETTFL